MNMCGYDFRKRQDGKSDEGRNQLPTRFTGITLGQKVTRGSLVKRLSKTLSTGLPQKKNR
jgi:hypothetical protein